MIDDRTAPYAALILRLSLGALFLAHAALKLFVFTPAGTAHYFASLGLPATMGYFVMLWEFSGGIALVLGLWTRLTALCMIPDLLGAIALVHAHIGFFFTDPGGGWEYPGLWAVALLVLALTGDGKWALKPAAYPFRRQGGGVARTGRQPSEPPAG